MSFIKSLLKLPTAGLNIGAGFIHELGASPIRKLGNNHWGMNLYGTGVEIGGPKNFFSLNNQFGAEVGKAEMFMGGISVLALGADLAMGFADGGVLGAARAGMREGFIGASIMNHTHATAAAAGINVDKRWGSVGAVGSWIARQAGGRAGAGLAMAGVGAVFGTGLLGTALAVPAAAWGARAGVAAGVPGLLGLGIVGGATAVAGTAAYGTYSLLKAGNTYTQRRKSIHTDGSLAAFSTQGAHTMRQRAIQAMSNNNSNLRSAFGQEAQLMHFPGRNYNSMYRR